jgi:hypothetical protein
VARAGLAEGFDPIPTGQTMPARIRIALALLMTLLCLGGAAMVGGWAHRPAVNLATAAPHAQVGQGVTHPPVFPSDSEPSHE